MFWYQTLLYYSKTKATLPLSSSQPHSAKKEIAYLSHAEKKLQQQQKNLIGEKLFS